MKALRIIQISAFVLMAAIVVAALAIATLAEPPEKLHDKASLSEVL